MNRFIKPEISWKTVLPGILIFAIIIIGIYFLVDYRRSLVDVKVKPTATVQPLIDQKQRFSDSLMMTIITQLGNINNSKQNTVVIREGFQNGYQNALQTSPDVCLPFINTMYRQAMRVDSANQVVIKRQDTTIVNYAKAKEADKDIMLLLKYQNQQKSDSIAQLKETKELTAKATKRQRIIDKLKGIGERVLYFAGGYGAGKVIP